MSMYLVFLTLKVNLFAINYDSTDFISQFILCSRSSANEVRVVSSAYILVLSVILCDSIFSSVMCVLSAII